MVKLSSLKQLKLLHSRLGGNYNGFYITVHGRDISIKEQVITKQTIATWSSPTRSGTYTLVSGRLHHRKLR